MWSLLIWIGFVIVGIFVHKILLVFNEVWLISCVLLLDLIDFHWIHIFLCVSEAWRVETNSLAAFGLEASESWPLNEEDCKIPRRKIGSLDRRGHPTIILAFLPSVPPFEPNSPSSWYHPSPNPPQRKNKNKSKIMWCEGVHTFRQTRMMAQMTPIILWF